MLNVPVRRTNSNRKWRTLETSLAASGSNEPEWSHSSQGVKAGVTQVD